MAEEIRLNKGIAYVHDGRVFNTDEERGFLLSLNPTGQVPVIELDGFVLRESMAINLYLAKKYDVLAPTTLEQQALAWQWSFWVMTSVDSQLLEFIRFRLGILGAQEDEQQAQECLKRLAKPFDLLNKELGDKPYLLGDEFTVADLNVASVLVWARMANLSMSQRTELADWLTRCFDREATRRITKA